MTQLGRPSHVRNPVQRAVYIEYDLHAYVESIARDTFDSWNAALRTVIRDHWAAKLAKERNQDG